MRFVRTIAFHTLRDILRSRVSYLIIAYAALVLLVAVLASQWTLGEEVRLVTDAGVALVLVFGIILLLSRGADLISREVDRKTVRVILARPIQRWHFVVGSFLGLVMVLGCLVVALGVALCVVLVPLGGGPSWPLVAALWGVFLELLMVAGVAVLASNLSSPLLATVILLIAVLAGHLASGLRDWITGTAELEHLPEGMQRVGAAYRSGPLNLFLRVGYYFLPVIAHVNFATEAANGLPVAWSRVVVGTLYALVYSSLAVGLAVLVFQGRDLS